MNVDLETLSIGAILLAMLGQMWQMNRTLGSLLARTDAQNASISKLVDGKHRHANMLQAHEGRLTILETVAKAKPKDSHSHSRQLVY